MSSQTCTECSEPAKVRGYCMTHYHRVWRYGDATTIYAPWGRSGKTVDGRFDEKWELDPSTGCHLWTAGLRGGYGQFWAGRGRSTVAHVFAWERVNGPKPEGMVLDHVECSTPRCVNPDHLKPTDWITNIQRTDKPNARTPLKVRCKHGHCNWAIRKTGPRAGRRSCLTCAAESKKRRLGA